MDESRGERRRPDAVLIAGPTASGKSALAIRLARRFGGVIVNADSMQVYRDLRVITARPTEEDTRAAPHRLYGTIDGAANHSVSLWLDDAATEIAGARTDGLLPIVVGGTGLYFKALTQGLSDIPDVPSDVRRRIRAWADGRSPGELHDELRRRDASTAARLRPSDPQRILRALEVFEATGESLASFQSKRTPPMLNVARCVAVHLQPDRDDLRTRIERRFDAMMEDGALVEVEKLAARHFDATLPVMRAHGVPPLLAAIRGTLAIAAAVQEGKFATRRYVKRQGTFVRNQLPAFRAVVPGGAEDAVARAIDQFA